MSKVEVRVGQVYEDCSLHPVFCTESDGDDVAGISLFDGSSPRSCSIHHCAVRALSLDETLALLSRRQEFLDAEAQWRVAFEQGDHEGIETYYTNVHRLRSELGLPDVR